MSTVVIVGLICWVLGACGGFIAAALCHMSSRGDE